jgi:hypothetical protein
MKKEKDFMNRLLAMREELLSYRDSVQDGSRPGLSPEEERRIIDDQICLLDNVSLDFWETFLQEQKYVDEASLEKKIDGQAGFGVGFCHIES